MMSTAPSIADKCVGTYHVLANQQVARDTYRIRVSAADIAPRCLPGQFVMIKPAGRTQPLLGRPLAVYEVIRDHLGTPVAIDLIYLVMGQGTKALSLMVPGEQVSMWGPLGKPFPVPNSSHAAVNSSSSISATDLTHADEQIGEAESGPTDFEHLLMVAGGIGQTPFFMVAEEALGLATFGARRLVEKAKKVSFAWGVRSRDYLCDVDRFEEMGVDTHLASNDGSVGTRGFITQVVEQLLKSDHPPTAVFACGPEPMLVALAKTLNPSAGLSASSWRVPTWVSLETKMACGYGVCFSCVCPVNEPATGDLAQQASESQPSWDYHRVCLDGPIFPAQDICWPELARQQH